MKKLKKDFELAEFLKSAFAIKDGEKVCVLIDLEEPKDIKGGEFLRAGGHLAQKKAYELFYEGLKGADLFAYRMTGGNNLELSAEAMSLCGQVVDFKKDIYQKYDVIFSIGTFSATAPLAAAAKEYGFRGASMPGLNEMILNNGLNTDFKKMAAITEKVKSGMTGADSADIEFLVGDTTYKLHFYLGDQVAQKVDGICHKKKMWTSLPAGKVYFVPYDAEGSFPMKFVDGGIAICQVGKGCIKKMKLLSGESGEFSALQKKIESDKAFGIIGELGFGTAELPYSGNYLQDAKIFGTFHFGIGRNDHLNGSVNLARFKDKKKAAHEDILFSKERTPEIMIKKVTLKRNGKQELLIENNEPQKYLNQLTDIA